MTGNTRLPPAARKKRFHHKVATGCSTCRTRRVKCDEAKPSCQRCIRTNRTCPGYIARNYSTSCTSQEPFNNIQWTPNITLPPSMHKSLEEARDIGHFLQRSAPMVSMASGSNDFWTIILPQVSWQYPETREMLYAFSCMDQHFMSSATDLAPKGLFKAALQHYNNAIRGLTRGVPTLHNVLLTSVLAWIFEATTNNFDRARIHIGAALRILNECDETNRDNGRPENRDEIIEAVRAVQFDTHWRMAKPDPSEPPEEQPTLLTIDDAWNTLEDAIQALDDPMFLEDEIDLVMLNRCTRRLRLWRAAFVDQRFNFRSDCGVALGAKRPLITLHVVGLTCLELLYPDAPARTSRKKQWNCALNDAECILGCDYGPKVDNGVRILLDIVISRARFEPEIHQRACTLRRRVKHHRKRDTSSSLSLLSESNQI